MTVRRWAVVATLAGIVLASIIGVWLMTPKRPPPLLDEQSWAIYKERFISAEGRVIDRDSDADGITHTEGQGYGMLLAEAAGDEKEFSRLWTWTNDHLRRPDGLFSWRWQGEQVADKNNASDGDLLIAWALLRAATHWQKSDYRAASETIVTNLANREIVRLGEYTVLLPGATGFQDDTGVVINLSYWLFPAFRDFATAFQQPVWQALSATGYDLLRKARFGTWRLPPDWLRIDGNGLRPADGFPPQYGFNAVRIPLNLAWDGQSPAELQEPFQQFWLGSANNDAVPAWVDLISGAVAPYPWQTGMKAIAALSKHLPGPLPSPGAKDGYFSSSLALLATIAAAETPR
jgi:endoglucanase